MAPRRPKMAQNGHKTSQDGPKSVSRWHCRLVACMFSPVYSQCYGEPTTFSKKFQTHFGTQFGWPNIATKIEPKITKKENQFFGAHFKTKRSQNQSEKKIDFETPFPRIPGVQIMPRQKKKRDGKKAFLSAIILYIRKEGMRPFKAL